MFWIPCVAMIANVAVDDVIQVMNNDQATGKKDIERVLDHYGIRQAKTMTKADNDTQLPSVCRWYSSVNECQQ